MFDNDPYYNELSDEEKIEVRRWLEEDNRKAFESYPEDEEVRFCSKCGRPLYWSSISYDEGWHIDSCF